MKYFKFTKKAVVIYITIIILLISALAVSAVSIMGIKNRTRDLNSSLAEANTKISQLEQANSEKEEQIKQYNIQIAKMANLKENNRPLGIDDNFELNYNLNELPLHMMLHYQINKEQLY